MLIAQILFSDVCKDFVTEKWSIEVYSSFNQTSNQLLQETKFFNVVFSISYAWGDSKHNSSNMQDLISLAPCCWNKIN